MKKFVQDASQSAVDTLTSSYSDIWEGAEGLEESSAFVQMMASNDLIFVVLGVSLLIWFILLFFIIRVDRNVARLEKELDEQKSKESPAEESDLNH
ncbi:MAG: CcmD family protein [Balneolaceae bacterium]